MVFLDLHFFVFLCVVSFLGFFGAFFTVFWFLSFLVFAYFGYEFLSCLDFSLWVVFGWRVLGFGFLVFCVCFFWSGVFRMGFLIWFWFLFQFGFSIGFGFTCFWDPDLTFFVCVPVPLYVPVQIAVIRVKHKIWAFALTIILIERFIQEFLTFKEIWQTMTLIVIYLSTNKYSQSKCWFLLNGELFKKVCSKKTGPDVSCWWLITNMPPPPDKVHF